MSKVIKKDDWNRKKSFIKLIMENIQEKSSDEDIIGLVTEGMKDRYSQDIKLSEQDIFLLYCKLIEAERTSVVKDLRLIEDLVNFEEEYIYETTYKNGQDNSLIRFPLLAYCVYKQVGWKDIAYIQQHKKIGNATNIQVELKKNTWDTQLIKESFLDSTLDSAQDSQQAFKKYKPYLMMGDVYVGFVTDKDDWSCRLRNAYKQFPEEVKEYLGYMAEHFYLTLALQAASAGDESETEEVSKSTQNWLGTYAKALRNMVETVIKEIKDKRTLTQEPKRQDLCEISQNVLAHLDACDKTMLKVLDEKTGIKLIKLIETLRENVKKVSSTYSTLGLFTLSASSTEKNQPPGVVQTQSFPNIN